jgi:hypothetical protein
MGTGIAAPRPHCGALVAPARARYDPSAAMGMPAHTTLNGLFLPGREVSPWAFAALRELFAATPRLALAPSDVRRFPMS